MHTAAFLNYMSERLDASLTSQKIIDMINNAQNEILGHDNQITKIVPAPFLHTGSEEMTGVMLQGAGSETFRVTTSIPTTTPKKGFLLISEAGETTSYEYTDYAGVTFYLKGNLNDNLGFGVEAPTCVVDDYNLIASGAVFSSQTNRRGIQYDIRSISRVFTFKGKTGNYRGYNQSRTSYKPDRSFNLASNELDIECDVIASKEALSADCLIHFWRENAPGKTTQTYMVEAQRWPQQVTNVNIPLTIPDNFQTNLLRLAIMRDVEYTEYGRDNYPEEQYQKYLKEFLSWAKTGVDSTTSNYTIPKDF